VDCHVRIALADIPVTKPISSSDQGKNLHQSFHLELLCLQKVLVEGLHVENSAQQTVIIRDEEERGDKLVVFLLYRNNDAVGNQILNELA
jgi:hypothetical protein